MVSEWLEAKLSANQMPRDNSLLVNKNFNTGIYVPYHSGVSAAQYMKPI